MNNYEWIKQAEKRDCEHCKHYVKGDSGYYSCSKWKCIRDDNARREDKKI